MNRFCPLLPLIVPSFSSKGNLLVWNPEKGKYISDNYGLLTSLDIKVSKSYLISAYDVYYGLMPENLAEWPETEYLFVDSGGYEINDSFDLSEKNKYNYNVFPWDANKMEMVYKKICETPHLKNTHIVLSCFDLCESFEAQFENANNLSKKFPNAIINCIIKCDNINAFVSYLANDDLNNYNISILGITEKELGLTIQERCLNIIKIHKILRQMKWNGYLHIFGGMEPNLMKLYFIAGADIFDGLAWQRYWLKDSTFLFAPDKYNVLLNEFDNKYIMMCDNLFILQSTTVELSASKKSREEMQIQLENILMGFEEWSIQEILNILEV